MLLKKLSIRGMCRSIAFSVKPTADDLEWVEEKLRLVERLSANAPPSNDANDLADWFDSYLKKHGRKKPKTFSFATIEEVHGVKLPSDYKKFVTSIGSKTFRDMDGEKGFDVCILPLGELDFQEFRNFSRGGERIDGVTFATTGHGDVLCFDVAKKNGDYPVYLYDHEMDDFEPFTTNFAACIKRLAGG